MRHDHFHKRKKLTFWPHCRGLTVYVSSAYLLLWCSVLISLLFVNVMYNLTTFWKYIWFDLITPPPPPSQGCVCGQNICYHVATCAVSFNLIINMTIFWKSLISASAQPPKSTQGDQGIKGICFLSVAPLPACEISAKNIDNCFSYCEI